MGDSDSHCGIQRSMTTLAGHERGDAIIVEKYQKLRIKDSVPGQRRSTFEPTDAAPIEMRANPIRK
jgi:hypothetical protein